MDLSAGQLVSAGRHKSTCSSLRSPWRQTWIKEARCRGRTRSVRWRLCPFGSTSSKGRGCGLKYGQQVLRSCACGESKLLTDRPTDWLTLFRVNLNKLQRQQLHTINTSKGHWGQQVIWSEWILIPNDNVPQWNEVIMILFCRLKKGSKRKSRQLSHAWTWCHSQCFTNALDHHQIWASCHSQPTLTPSVQFICCCND